MGTPFSHNRSELCRFDDRNQSYYNRSKTGKSYNLVDDFRFSAFRTSAILDVIESGAPPFPTPPSGQRGWPWTCDESENRLQPQARDDTLPKVTVITPSYNQGRYLEEAIRSVVIQDHPNIEYLVIDGGSTDRSVEIIKRYDPWITSWESAPDGGQADAINKGFARATGEYVCWLNSDDVMYQGFVSRRVAQFADREQTDLIYGDIDVGWENGERTVLRGEPSSFFKMLRTLDVPVPQQGAMWRRSTILRLGGLDPRWHVVLDREFFLRIANFGSLEYIPGSCGFFRQHGSAKSVAEATRWVVELPLMYTELFANEDLETAAKKSKRVTMANVHLLCSDIQRNAGNWISSFWHLGKALVWKPNHAASAFIAARASGLRRRLSTDAHGKPA